jgi:hypothetical protein
MIAEIGIHGVQLGLGISGIISGCVAFTICFCAYLCYLVNK